MDPISQGVLGSALPQSAATQPKHILYAGLVGFGAGILPDFDVLIRSSTDPLLFLEYHRQFTHSLIIIPLGGLVAAALMYPLLRRKLAPRLLYLYATLGYGTHALLDCCTAYGTQLFWPFSDYRVAWNNVSIVDPLFTVPVLLGAVLAALKSRRTFARAAVLYAICYLLLGVAQNQRAVAAGEVLAKSRGHSNVEVVAKPAVGNLVLWKTIYSAEGRYFVDAVRMGLTAKVYAGDSVPVLDLARDFPGLPADSVQARDVERFRWFSMGYLAVHPKRPQLIGDVRYSFVPNQIAPLWGVRIDPNTPDKHVTFENARDRPDVFGMFLAMIFGDDLP